jgi:hypothetical protein
MLVCHNTCSHSAAGNFHTTMSLKIDTDDQDTTTNTAIRVVNCTSQPAFYSTTLRLSMFYRTFGHCSELTIRLHNQHRQNHMLLLTCQPASCLVTRRFSLRMSPCRTPMPWMLHSAYSTHVVTIFGVKSFVENPKLLRSCGTVDHAHHTTLMSCAQMQLQAC